VTKIDFSSHVVPVSIEDELKRSYLDYAMSVIVARALPDVRDGLKPVHRRILYTMGEEGFDYNKPHKKSARAVGQVISKYHPHGTDPIYGALARMAQDFAMRLCLVDGHGNFGSMDGDKPAAMRYTEVRLAQLAHYILEDYDKETIEFQPNYDDTLQMPVVLPARFPNLLVNGASGIAVGMATNIPCHNLGEVIDACCALVDDPLLEDFSEYILGPDFPTGGIILGRRGFNEAYRTGRGSFLIRGKTTIESSKKDRQAIIITEVPYQVNKASLVTQIAELVNAKELEGISDLRDESDRHGVRVVIELKKDTIPEIVLNRLYASTALQTSFGINMLALHKGTPLQLSLLDILRAFIEFRREVVTRRTQFFLRKARERAHILVGLSVAISHIDAVIEMIKASNSGAEALEALMAHSWPLEGDITSYLKELDEDFVPSSPSVYTLSEEQGKAILAMRLQRLTGMEQNKLQEELASCYQDILSFLELLGSSDKMNALIKSEMQDVKAKFPSPRLTSIEDAIDSLTDEDLIPCEDMVVTVSVKGYIKRVPLKTYRSQKHGGRGRQAMDTVTEDEVARIFVADTHTVLLFFTSMGKAYQLKVYDLPLGSATSRGKPLVGLFPLEKGETLATLLPLPRENTHAQIVFATSSGDVRKNALTDFLSIRSNGKIAMKLSEDERLVSVALASDDQDILLSSRHGKAIRFSVGDLRQFSSRSSTGVRGISLKKGDEVVSMTLIHACSFTPEQIEAYRQSKFKEEGIEPLGVMPLDKAILEQMAQEEEFVLSISESGFGKRTSTYAYRRANRGGQGVASMDITARTGSIVNTLPVGNQDDVLLLTDQGQLLRCPVHAIRISARKTQGVKIFRLADKERIVSVATSPYQPPEVDEGDEAYFPESSLFETSDQENDTQE
jgi:DNA gyrase subunit A